MAASRDLELGRSRCQRERGLVGGERLGGALQSSIGRAKRQEQPRAKPRVNDLVPLDQIAGGFEGFGRGDELTQIEVRVTAGVVQLGDVFRVRRLIEEPKRFGDVLERAFGVVSSELRRHQHAKQLSALPPGRRVAEGAFHLLPHRARGIAEPAGEGADGRLRRI